MTRHQKLMRNFKRMGYTEEEALELAAETELQDKAEFDILWARCKERPGMYQAA